MTHIPLWNVCKLHHSLCRGLQLAYRYVFFSNTIRLLFPHLTCVNVLVAVRRHLRDTEVAWAIHIVQDWSFQRNVVSSIRCQPERCFSIMESLLNYFDQPNLMQFCMTSAPNEPRWSWTLQGQGSPNIYYYKCCIIVWSVSLNFAQRPEFST